MTEECSGEDPIKHSLHHAFKGEVGREEERMEDVSSIATRRWCKVCWNRAWSAARNVFLQTVLCRIHSTGYTHLVRCVSALQENDSHLKFNLQYKYKKKTIFLDIYSWGNESCSCCPRGQMSYTTVGQHCEYWIPVECGCIHGARLEGCMPIASPPPSTCCINLRTTLFDPWVWLVFLFYFTAVKRNILVYLAPYVLLHLSAISIYLSKESQKHKDIQTQMLCSLGAKLQ